MDLKNIITGKGNLIFQKTFFFLLTLLVFNGEVAGQCSSISFTASDTVICAPGAVDFKITGVQATDSVVWEIGKEKINGRNKFTQIFLDKGVHDVKFTVYRNGIFFCSQTSTDFLMVGKAPDAITFDYNDSAGCREKDSLTFTGTNDGIISWHWIIGGKSYPDTGNIITHYFSKKGYYDLSVKVTDTLGCEKTEHFDSLIVLTGMSDIDFFADTTKVKAPGEIDFFSSGSGKGVSSYVWNFEGGNPSSSGDENPENIGYSFPGSYDVSLKVTTKTGCTSTELKKDYILVGYDAKLDFKKAGNKSCLNSPVTLYNTSSSTGGSFAWRAETGKITGDSTGDTVRIIFSKTGYHSVSLVFKSFGTEEVLARDSFIFIPVMEASFSTGDSCSCKFPHSVQFKNNTSGSGSFNYEWTFFDRDGKTILGQSSGENPSNSYSSFGSFPVRLVAVHPGGCTDTFLNREAVKILSWQSTFEMDTLFGCKDDELLVGLMPDTFCSEDSITYSWSISKPDGTGNYISFTTVDSLVYFGNEGMYPVTVEVRAGNICQTTGKGLINISDPVASFFTSKETMCTGDTFTLKGTSTPEQIGFFHEWKLFETGSADTFGFSGKKVTATIPVPGTYTVEYRIFSSPGKCEKLLVKNNLLEVGGIKGTVSYKETQKCVPLNGELEVNIQKNHHPDNPSGSITYNWSVRPSQGVFITDSLAEKTEVTINKPGCFNVALTLENSEGCKSKIKEDSLICGGVDARFSMPDTICVGTAITPRENSIINPNKFSWFATSTSISFFPSNGVREPEIYFADSGWFKIKLIVENSEGCTDELNKNIYVQQVEADFLAQDTLTYCAPSFIKFTGMANTPVDSFFWDFGENSFVKTTNSTITHVYEKNSGGVNSGFDVSLVVISSHGCRDTVRKKKYMTVIGPYLDFDISPDQGCEPLEVSFKNNSENYTTFYFDYGDYSPLDTNRMDTHSYRVVEKSRGQQTFNPAIFARDSLGCFAVYQHDSGLVVKSKPVAGFTADTLSGCDPLVVEFVNRSKWSDRYGWDFENDGTIDDNGIEPVHTYSAGNHTVKLIAKSNEGCSDTLIRKGIITVFPSPEADFFTEKRRYCPGDEITVIDNSTPADSIIEFFWSLNKADTFYGKKVTLNPILKPGDYSLRHAVLTRNGCRDSIIRENYFRIKDTITGRKEIKSISFIEPDKLDISWEGSFFKRFKNYSLIIEGDTEQFIYFYDTNYIHNSPFNYNKTNLPEIYFQVIDSCGKGTEMAGPYVPTYLTVKDSGFYKSVLSWTPFKGWKNLAGYSIYRNIEGGNYEKIATVGPGVFKYTDSALCDVQYCYYVVANHGTKNYSSKSNVACALPRVPLIKQVLKVNYASVEEPGKIKVEYEDAEVNYEKKFYLERKTGGNWDFNYSTTDFNFFLDTNVVEKERRYFYRVRLGDKCGNNGPAGNVVSTILLKSTVIEDRIRLLWNTHKVLDGEGVDFHLQVLEEGEWKDIVVQDHDDSTFVYGRQQQLSDIEYCYRIMASDSSTRVFSNESCIILPSEIFIPNAFSPNNDGINDYFGITPQSLHGAGQLEINRFMLKINNQWGEEVFKSYNINKLWDGTFKGKPAPAGHYIYRIEAVGINDDFYSFKGTLLLIR